MAKPKIHFIITGGTIDSSYNPRVETATPNKTSVIPSYIENVIKPHFSASFQTLFMKDSGDITDAMRRKIAGAIKKTKTPHIIITHGTVTMARTAKFLKTRLGKIEKIVILTGAMIPLKDIDESDGGFNIGFAAASFANLKPGVYIAMNGKIFEAGKVRKDIKNARFENAREKRVN